MSESYLTGLESLDLAFSGICLKDYPNGQFVPRIRKLLTLLIKVGTARNVKQILPLSVENSCES